jgi:hypothetical protein
MDFYSSGEPLFLDSKTAAAKDTAISEVYLECTDFPAVHTNEACLFGVCFFTSLLFKLAFHFGWSLLCTYVEKSKVRFLQKVSLGHELIARCNYVLFLIPPSLSFPFSRV